MGLEAVQKEKIFKKYGSSKNDSGSVYSQVALFTERIQDLTSHLKENRKDVIEPPKAETIILHGVPFDTLQWVPDRARLRGTETS